MGALRATLRGDVGARRACRPARAAASIARASRPCSIPDRAVSSCSTGRSEVGRGSAQRRPQPARDPAPPPAAQRFETVSLARSSAQRRSPCVQLRRRPRHGRTDDRQRTAASGSEQAHSAGRLDRRQPRRRRIRDRGSTHAASPKPEPRRAPARPHGRGIAPTDRAAQRRTRTGRHQRPHVGPAPAPTGRQRQQPRRRVSGAPTAPSIARPRMVASGRRRARAAARARRRSRRRRTRCATASARTCCRAARPCPEAEAALRWKLAELQQALEAEPRGKFVNLAVFDHRWQDVPERPPRDRAAVARLARRGDRRLSGGGARLVAAAAEPAAGRSPRRRVRGARRALPRLRTPAEGLDFAVRLLERTIPSEAISACLYDINTDELRFVALAGVDARAMQGQRRAALGRAVRSGGAQRAPRERVRRRARSSPRSIPRSTAARARRAQHAAAADRPRAPADGHAAAGQPQRRGRASRSRTSTRSTTSPSGSASSCTTRARDDRARTR